MQPSSNFAPAGVIRRGQGPAVMLLHGFCGSALGWGPVLDALSTRYHVIAPDWPGFGALGGSAPCATIADMAGYALEVAERCGVDRLHVVGHSMSGYVVQQLLLTAGARIDKAVLYGAGLNMNHALRFESADATLAALRRDGVMATVRRIAATWFVHGAAAPNYAQCVRAGAGMSIDAAVAAMQAARDADFRERLHGVEHAVLVVAGAQDRTFPPTMVAALAAALAHADLCLLPWCAHAAHWESPARFNDILLDFLERKA